MSDDKVQFEKRELVLTLWTWAINKDREEYFFELISELVKIEENQK